jgi:signal transduction histidine kinase/CheY-like chemotaxis protein
VVIGPSRLLRWRVLGTAWGCAALLTWGFGLGQLLLLPWNANTALLLSSAALTAALLLTATVHWLPGLLLGWAALLIGQLWAWPMTGLADGLQILLLGFDLVLLALGMVLGQAVRQSAARVVAERMSRRELAQLKARMTDQSQRLSTEADYRHDVEQALNEARSAADVANRAKTEFLATMSHEVRTPLNGIVPILEMLRETRLDETQQEFLDTAYNSARHLLRIINDVLDFAKAEAGKLELESIEIDLRDLIETVTDLMSKSAERRGLRLRYKVADDVPRRVRGDPIRLRQVLTNLVSNAIKFTSKGEIRVEVHKRRASRKEVELVFSITDTGEGMSRETQRRLFRAFKQADASTTRKHGGTGLGLVICKRLVQLMGGRIGVKSQVGKGSTFWFVLPMRKSASDVPPARRDLAGLRVLTLVDDAATGEKLSGVLADWRMTEERVDNPLTAISKLKSSAQLGKSWSYDLLIMALSGSRQGFQALVDEVRGEPVLADMKIVAVTPSTLVLQELQKLPGVFAMEAPIDYRLLQRQLHRLFDVAGNRIKAEEDTDALFDSLALDFEPRGGVLDVVHPVVRGNVVARALLVEDNPVNLSVARRMLAKLGIDTLVARDGQEAIDLVANEQLDLALMDCQMPNMDGYEATRRIRAAEQQADPPRHLPIIAMTANVMTGDREKCLAAGMDDYLGKPLEFAPMRRALEPWVRLRQQANNLQQSRGLSYAAGGLRPAGSEPGLAQQPRDMADAGAVEVAADEPLDQAKLDELRTFMGDELPHLIGQFLESAPQQMEALARAVQDKDLGAMVLPAHSLKSSSANLGANQLSQLAARLEHAARTGEAKAAWRLHDQLGAAYKSAVAALAAQQGVSDS